jgi:hypothetical protein
LPLAEADSATDQPADTVVPLPLVIRRFSITASGSLKLAPLISTSAANPT